MWEHSIVLSSPMLNSNHQISILIVMSWTNRVIVEYVITGCHFFFLGAEMRGAQQVPGCKINPSCHRCNLKTHKGRPVCLFYIYYTNFLKDSWRIILRSGAYNNIDNDGVSSRVIFAWSSKKKAKVLFGEDGLDTIECSSSTASPRFRLEM